MNSGIPLRLSEVLNVERKTLMDRMEKFYEALTGSKCEAGYWIVSKVSLRGTYFVHRLESCDFYEVNVRGQIDV